MYVDKYKDFCGETLGKIKQLTTNGYGYKRERNGDNG